MKKIAVFGTGVVGQVMAEKLISLGHRVTVGTRNVVESLSRTKKDSYGRPGLSAWIKENNRINLETYSNAASWAEIIVNATNGSGTLQALELARKENLANKIIIDISNPLDFSKGFPPSLSICNTDSLAEQIQRSYPEAKVVKTLNTMTSFVMVNPGLIKEDHTVFVSGNDEAAKSEVKVLLQSFGWKEDNIIDLGDISSARGTEQLLPVWVRLYGTLKTAIFNFKVVKGEAIVS